MKNHLLKVRLPGRKRIDASKRTITFKPPYDERGSITIIAGKNGTGKSYLLKAIEKCCINHDLKVKEGKPYDTEKLEFNDVTVYPNDFKNVIGSVLRISDINELTRNAESINTIASAKTVRRGVRDRKSEISNQVSIQQNLQDFFGEVLNEFQKDSLFDFNFDIDKWNNKDTNNYRESFFSYFDVAKVYRIPDSLELVNIFESFVDGKLYIGLTNKKGNASYFELYLCKNDKSTITFRNWSVGQKVTFISFLMVMYRSPSILLFDEIENHLHPEYISKLFNFFSKHVSQTIIATHHPHIIFSRYADSIWYIEEIEQQHKLEKTLNKNIKNLNRGHLRKCIELKNNYEKLIQVYRLFLNSDNKLLRISSSVVENLDHKLLNIFTSLFNYGIIRSNSDNDPDIQSDELYEYFRKSLISNDTISILEMGAGYGRLLEELIKIDPGVSKENIYWSLYEPFEEVANELKKVKAKYKNFHCDIHETLNSITKKYDFILYPNILHEITPKSIAEYFTFSLQNLTEKGKIIIVDIFPLIMPEKFSVPFKITEWEELLELLKLNFKVRKVNFKQSSFDAYWIEVKANNNSVKDAIEINNIIEKYYSENILLNRCKEYERRQEFDDLRESIGLMCELTSIASISSYNNGVWKT